MTRIIDRFHQTLATRLNEELSSRVEQLINGSATRMGDEPTSTAEKYAAQVSYIRAIRHVLELCDEISDDQYGNRKPEAGE